MRGDFWQQFTMPVCLKHPIRRIDEAEFSEIAYHVMGRIFAIHSEFGRLFDEKIYKRELARRLPDVALEVPLEVSFDSFQKTYYLDVIAGPGALFEFKAVEEIVPRHRAQQMNYLLLADLEHGKLVNVRSEKVGHEFVNATLRPWERKQFAVLAGDWVDPDQTGVKEWFSDFLFDLGTCLDVHLYEEALIHRFGGAGQVERAVEVVCDGHVLGAQNLRLMAERVAFKITTFEENMDRFESHARRLLQHTRLDALQWINIGRRQVRFTTLRP
jgi:GxxExxY protein